MIVKFQIKCSSLIIHKMLATTLASIFYNITYITVSFLAVLTDAGCVHSTLQCTNDLTWYELTKWSLAFTPFLTKTKVLTCHHMLRKHRSLHWLSKPEALQRDGKPFLLQSLLNSTVEQLIPVCCLLQLWWPTWIFYYSINDIVNSPPFHLCPWSGHFNTNKKKHMSFLNQTNHRILVNI